MAHFRYVTCPEYHWVVSVRQAILGWWKKKKESSSDVGSVSDYHRWEICRCLLTRSMFIFDIMVKLSHKEGITVTDV